MGGTHSGVSPGADDNVMCGFDGGGSGFGCGGESRNRLVAYAGVRQNGPSMSLAAAVDGQAPCGGQQADNWAFRWVVAMVEAVGVPALLLCYATVSSNIQYVCQ